MPLMKIVNVICFILSDDRMVFFRSKHFGPFAVFQVSSQFDYFAKKTFRISVLRNSTWPSADFLYVLIF